MKKKSRILAALLTVCLVITLMPVISFAAETAGTAGLNDNIVVLYSGDINGGVDANIGLAGMAAYANEMKTKSKYVELVDVGNAVSGSVLASISKGEYVVGKNALSNITGNSGEMAVPGVLALIAAIVSIIVKEAMFWYTRHYAKKIDSGALMADAWHHRSDALSSIGAFIGIIFARMGYVMMDSIACLVICVFIVKAAYDIFKDAIDKMVDKSCSLEVEAEIRTIVMSVDGVKGIDSLSTRLFGNKMYVDIEIRADGEKTLNETHEIAEAVHDSIEAQFEKVKHIMVHVNPD